MTLQEKINSDFISAMKARDEIRISTLRLIKAAIANALIDRKQLSELDVIGIISKQAKQCHEAIAGFEKGNRADLVTKEKKELEIISGYLPKQLSAEEVEQEVTKAVQETGATSKAQMGQVMKLLMEKLKGRADGKLISELVTQKLV